MTIGERIKNRREELGLTQDEVAKKCGYKSRSSVNKIELSRDLPLKKVSIMAEALETTPAYLMGWEEEHNFSDDFMEKLSKYPPEEVKRAMEIIDLYEKASPEGRAAFETLLKLSQQKS